MKKKGLSRLLAVILAGVMAFALTACGGGSKGSSSASGSGSAGPSESSAQKEETPPAEESSSSASEESPAPVEEYTIYRLEDVEAVQLLDEEANAAVEKVSVDPFDTTGLKVGFSQMEVNNNWRIVENDSLETSITEAGWEYVYRDAESSTEKQNRDIIDLVDEGCDIIIVAPYEATGMQTGLAYAEEKGIPVITIDRSTEGYCVTNILGDFVDVGYKMGQRMRQAFGDETINFIEITGTAGSSVAMDITKGIDLFMEDDGNINRVASADGNFGRDESLAAAENLIQAYGDQFNAVFCHVDDAAVASIQALKEAGMTPGTDPAKGDICIASMCGYVEGFDAMLAGELLCSVECTARFGPVVVDIINRLAEGGEIDNRLVMPCRTYDFENAEQYYAEAL